MNARRCITFAGVVGSSKTPIANYLSGIGNLPVLNNDAIRTEVTEDLLMFDQEIYDARQKQRCKNMLSTGESFIYDASVDRKWPELDEWLKQAKYNCFIISLDLSHDFLRALYKAKDYDAAGQLPAYIEQHEAFVSRYNDVIGLHITDADFSDRLAIAHSHVNAWLRSSVA